MRTIFKQSRRLRFSVLLLALLLLLGPSGCLGQESPVPASQSVTASADDLAQSVPAPSQAGLPELPKETVIPLLSTETEAPTATEPVPETEPLDVEEAILRYEASPLDYAPLDRAPEKSGAPVPEAAYSLCPDGFWRRAEDSGDSAVLMLAGDLLCQTRQQEAARTEDGYDFRGSFHYVKPIFSEADLVIGNLEAVLSERAPYMAEQPAVEGRPHLNAPPVYLEAIRDAGFDLVVMSNNHNCDAGVRGVFDTLDRVDEYGLIHTGTFRSGAEPRFALVEVNGIRIGIMSYATYFNKKDAHLTEDGVRTLLNPYDPETAAEDAAAARRAGAEYLLVYIHWGTEYTNTPNEKQFRIARELADAGFDFIVGSHPHALQPFDSVTSADGRRVPVLYSMGNFVSHQKKTVTKDTIILRLVLKRDEGGGAVLAESAYIPCRVFKRFGDFDYVVLPLTEPYRQGLTSSYFGPALERISGVIGPALPMLGDAQIN